MAERKLNILVTGALGHIGSRLIRDFSHAQVGKIILLDNLESQRYSTLFNLPENFRYQFFEADVRTANFEEILKNIDVVIHLAALTNAEGTLERFREVEEVNFLGLQRVADACLKLNVRLLFPSTTSVYASKQAEVDEASTELDGQSPYAVSKVKAERYLNGLKASGLRFVICRFGTIFGWSIGMRFHTATNKFSWQAVTGRPLSVWKTALKQKRPYLYLGDCVRAINHILEKDLFNGEVYNIVTTNSTVEEIIGTLKLYVPSLKVSYVDSAIMNNLSYKANDDKIRSTGFAPEGNLEDGIKEAILKLSGIVPKK